MTLIKGKPTEPKEVVPHYYVGYSFHAIQYVVEERSEDEKCEIGQTSSNCEKILVLFEDQMNSVR